MAEQNYRIRIKLGEIEIEAEGDKEFVEKHIEEFRKEMPKISKELPSKEKPILPEIPREEVELEHLSISEFYKQRQPKDNNETVVVFAYWLTKKERKEEFKTVEISACFSNAGVPKPRNVTQHMKMASSGKKAFLMKGSKKGLWKLTITGEKFIEERPRKGKE
jgi:hypothetical protein